MKATGEPFSSGSVPWNGILISSQPNEMVRAVGKGKVIFLLMSSSTFNQ